jgi:hypothetical protein
MSVLYFDLAQYYAEQVPPKAGRVEACPVISAPKVRNSLKGREIGLSTLTCPDIGKI